MRIKTTNEAFNERLERQAGSEAKQAKIGATAGHIKQENISKPAKTPLKHQNPCYDCEFWDESFSQMEETGLCRITNRCIDGTKTCKDFKRRQGE